MSELDEHKFVLYEADDNDVIANVLIKDETLWTTQKEMARLFDVGIPAISKHLNNIFDEEELEKEMVISKMETTTQHGAIEGKTQKNESDFDRQINNLLKDE